MITALGIGLGSGWMLPAQAPADPAKGPQYKDRAEYDVVETYSKATDAKGRLAALDKWKQAYPDTELFATRDDLYLGVYGELKDNRKQFEQAKAIRAKNPNHYFSITTILGGIYGLATPPPPPAADLSVAEEVAKYTLDNADKIFATTNKPANVTDAQWTQYRPNVMTLALRTNAWVWVQRKDDARAETELTKFIQADPDQPGFSYMLGQAKFSQYQKQKDLTKLPGAIFHIARAASYAGPNAATISAANRTAYLNSAKSIYKQYHGSEEGFPALEALAKANALPPADFKIESITDIQAKQMADRDTWEKEHPDLAFWDNTIKGPLTGATAESVFETNFKESLIPPGPPGTPFSMFKAKIISMTPETSPKEMTVAVFNGAVADAKLTFDPPLPGTMPVGSDIEFKGVPTSFQKDPFMVTFAIDMEEKQMTGWTGTGPVNAKGKATKAAPKGGAKGTAKGKASAKGK
jgi:hypothetical protein